MDVGVVLLNFGEPEAPGLRDVTRFLERIFLANASLDGEPGTTAARRRSRELAERRAPALLEAYRAIGGSPLNRQARRQAGALAAELGRRGHRARAYVGMQFTPPLVREAVERARADRVERLIGLPAYPLCGPSTSLAALAELATAVQESDWSVELLEVGGWHRHPAYPRLRVDAIRRYCEARGVELRDPSTRLIFSAHGTPLKYLRGGSRYRMYVDELCGRLAAELETHTFEVGFQNHANRRVKWTGPDVREVVRHTASERDVRQVVVDAVSFMHEQSETLVELDVELREEAEGAGLEFHRVPIPHDDPRFPVLLADVVEPLLVPGAPPGPPLTPCTCRPGAVCLNAGSGAPARGRRAGRSAGRRAG